MSDGLVKLLNGSLSQNPAPVELEGQDFLDKHRVCVEQIMANFFEVLPSNYISATTGPYYTLQFQALAEQLCRIQITAQEVYEDSDFDFTRPEFLFQFLGSLVFPDPSRGYPSIDGDVSFRDFLKEMVILLLRGSTKDAVEEGLNLLTEADITLLEKAVISRGNPNALWGLDEQFEFEINIEAEGGTRFPEDPFTLKDNLRIVLEALKPAHTIYTCRFLFRESLESLVQDEVSWDFHNHYYEDTRKNCAGARSVTSTAGETLSDTFLFTDTSRDFSSIMVGARLRVGFVVAAGSTASFVGAGTTFTDLSATFETWGVLATQVLDIYRGVGIGRYSITSVTDENNLEVGTAFPADSTGSAETFTIFSSPNFGDYRVTDILTFPAGDDSTARAYTTAPTGLSGTATVSGGLIVDGSQDFSLAAEGEILTFFEGPNIGSYRLKTLQGSNGGPVGFASGPGTKVLPAPTTLRVDRRMREARSGQTYEVVVDRMGVKVPSETDTLQASGTLQVASLPSPGDTLSVDGLPLTAVAGVPVADEFTVGATVSETATNIADAINLATNSFDTLVVASVAGAVVTLTAVVNGTEGNTLTLATSVPLVLIMSGATLLGGADGENASVYFLL